MWEEVAARKHRVVKVFPAHFARDPTTVVMMHEVEFMMFGAVAYRLRHGKGDAAAGWAAHALLKRDGLTAPWRLGYYRVYIHRADE